MKHLALALLTGVLAATSLPAQQLIRNGSFDELMTHWAIEQHAPAVADAVVTSDGPKGTRALMLEVVEPGDAHWKVQLAQRGFSLNASKRYRVSFQAKSDKTRWIGVALGQAEVPYKALAFSSSAEVRPEWSRISVILRPSEDTPTGRFLITNLGMMDGTLWVTDVSVVEE